MAKLNEHRPSNVYLPDSNDRARGIYLWVEHTLDVVAAQVATCLVSPPARAAWAYPELLTGVVVRCMSSVAVAVSPSADVDLVLVVDASTGTVHLTSAGRQHLSAGQLAGGLGLWTGAFAELADEVNRARLVGAIAQHEPAPAAA